jgi:geranylgeranyl reductase family protein
VHRCDVVIVGGGPAGATCARRLRQADFDVVVLDQARFPRDKVCAGWITPAVLELADVDRAEYAKTRVLAPIRAFRVSYGDRPEVRVAFDRDVSYGIRRREFDEYLLRRSGALVYEGIRVERIERDGHDWVVEGMFRAPVLVGSGGHFCPVARLLGARVAREPAVVAQAVEWKATVPDNAPEPELWFLPGRSGYAWRIGKQGFLNVGVGCLGHRDLPGYRTQFVARLHTAGVAPPAWRGHAYLTAGLARRTLVGEGVVLTGDAAGLADPRSGEGIRAAVESGLLAAECIVGAQGDYSRARLATYATTVARRFAGPAHQWTVPELVTRTLMSQPWFVREIVVRRWFLHMTDQRTAAVGP